MDLAARLRTRFGRRLLGPMTPPVDRIRGEYLVGLLLKIESGASSARARELLTAELKTLPETRRSSRSPSSSMSILNDLVRDVASLLFPPRCAVCGSRLRAANARSAPCAAPRRR